ncbi:hypothetical protein TNCT6_75210 [Streptomyces sp. 6-11-2]|nr:hypothetical protein TNCT6_75210 [Streptomyces sp. 6-11-2]
MPWTAWGGRSVSTPTSYSGGSRCGAPVVLLVESNVPPPRMIVFGVIDFASPSSGRASS